MPGQILSENIFAADRNQLSVVRTALGSVGDLYPGFDHWLSAKVGSGLDNGSRRVLVYRQRSRILGIAIAKRTPSERKLCTLWVDQGARGQRAGAALGSALFRWLNTDKPLFTVPEERLTEFRGLLNGWGFGQPNGIEGLYRDGKIEYVFNGAIVFSSAAQNLDYDMPQVFGIERGDLFEARA